MPTRANASRLKITSISAAVVFLVAVILALGSNARESSSDAQRNGSNRKSSDNASRSGQFLLTTPAIQQSEPQTYRASTDYSGSQDHMKWHYLDSTGTDLTFLPEQWGGVWTRPNTSVFLGGGGWGHPGAGIDAVRQWRPTEAGSIRITGTAFDTDSGGGDGVYVAIKKGTQTLWDKIILNGDSTGGSYDVATNVAAGDQISFVINGRNEPYFDSTIFDPTIVFSPGVSVYQASTDFSNTQGLMNWSYLESGGTPLTFVNYWGGEWTLLPNNSVWLGNNWGHPGATDAIRRWEAPAAGTIRITGTAFDMAAPDGDGVVVSIKQGTEVLWQHTINNGATTGVSYDLTRRVAQGTKIDFVINQRGGPAYDTTGFDPRISFTPGSDNTGGYSFRRTITIDHTKVPNTDQSNFPVLISGSYDYLKTETNGGYVRHSNGYDVVFTSDPGCVNKLNHEVEAYSASGAVTYWVKVPNVSHSSNSIFYLCYGNPGISSDQSNKSGVWDSNYKGAWHLPNGTTLTTTDSTASANHSSSNSASATGGKFYGAASYNGAGQSTVIGNAASFDYDRDQAFSFEFWLKKPMDSVNNQTLISKKYTYWTGAGFQLWTWAGSNNAIFDLVDSVGSIYRIATDFNVQDNSWHHIVCSYDGSNNQSGMRIYVDGNLTSSGSSAAITNSIRNGYNLTLGTNSGSAWDYLNGSLEEVRFSSAARSADWIKTQYNNQSSPTTFYSISANSSTPAGGGSDLVNARLDPVNRTGGGGEDPLSRNFNWSVPLFNLPGRSGLDLGLSLSYNSLVWTRSGSTISFDDDRGFPSPGFRLGFPVIQPDYFNSVVQKHAFMLIKPNGERVELRQVGSSSSTLYASADSSHLSFETAGTTKILRTPDGTQLLYELKNGEYQCTEIKDRNGNFITISYKSFGRIDKITDTLSREIQFYYDTNNGNVLTSIEQVWNKNTTSQRTQVWAEFTYDSAWPIETNFSGVTSTSPQTGSTINVLTRVKLNNNSSRFDFDYTSWGQVWRITNFAADGTKLNYRSYDLPLNSNSSVDDCPRFTQRHDWAKDWNRNSGSPGASGLPAGAEQEVTTYYTVPADATWTPPGGSQLSGKVATVTSPDGTSNKIYFAGAAGSPTGWQRGLPSMVETYSAENQSTPQRRSATKWTQDGETASFILNPRVVETNVSDSSNNHRRVTTTYSTFTLPGGISCSLPIETVEYAPDLNTVLRHTQTDYRMNAGADSNYLDRHIIGLVSEQRLYENAGTGTPRSRISFGYDEGAIQGNDTPVQHYGWYGSSFNIGRANLTSVTRHDVLNGGQSITSTMRYNTAGSLVDSFDSLHHVYISYTDSFSDGDNSHNTFAYPTTVTDPDNFSSKAQYNFDFGAVTRTEGPPPAGHNTGAVKNFTYDSSARLLKAAIEFNGVANYSYTRFEYPDSQNRVDSYSTIEAGQYEAHSFQITDGHGRVIATASDLPNSSGGFSGQLILYDAMGRSIKTSNPTETTASGIPAQWAFAGDDAASIWRYTAQTFDWKGRPLVTTNPDDTTEVASYSGCGCAGGEMVTLTDEGTLVNGNTQKRQQKIYKDVLGRPWKTELLNWQGGSPYSTSITSYNARDQVTLVSQYQGAESSGVHQDTTMFYDGYGRLKTRHTPEQQVVVNNPASTDHTTWDYNPDDTIEKVTDARGAVSNFTYNNRGLATAISYTLLPGVPSNAISATANVSFAYDAAGNRISMTDGLGSMSYQYDQLSRLTSETRTFNDLSGTKSLEYTYNLAGGVASVEDPTEAVINYGYDKTGRLTGVTGTSFAGVTQYASSLQYRAFGGLKSLTYGTEPTTHNGDTTRTQTYNLRQKLATLQVGSILSAEFTYHDDGQIKYAKDNTDAVKDRAYNYDQVGRLAEGLSGAEARNPTAAADGIYRQTYQYDAWSNLTGRAMNRFWSGGQSFTTSYVNNRDVDSSYDADGRSIFDGDSNRSHLYDAVGRQTKTSESSQASSWGSALAGAPTPSPSPGVEDPDSQPNVPTGGYYTTTTLTITQSYDGDGQSLKRLETKTHSTPGFAPVISTRAEYYVRSSVLAGKVITELDSQGQKLKTHVYAGDVEVAEQNGQTVQSVTWTYSNPVTGTTAKQTSNGYNKKEHDPFGLELGTTDPYVQHAEPDYPALAGGSSYLDGGNPFGRGNGCAWDGAPIRCQVYAFALNSGVVDDPDHQRGFYRLGHRTPFDQFDNAAEYGDSVDAWHSSAWVGRLGRGERSLGEGHFAPPQNPSSGSFYDCFYSSGLAKTHAKDQYADAKLFTQAAADLLLDINRAEGGSVSLLAVTLMNENTTFDLYLKPNTKFKDTEWWDVGPFQLNQHYTNAGIESGAVKNEGRNYLDYGQIYGRTVKENQPFTGSPLANGRMAARRLNAASSKSDRQRAINYAGRAGRGDSYDSFAPLFDRFFNCYRR